MAERRQASSWLAAITRASFNSLIYFISTAISIIRPYAPKIIPLLVFSLFIPVIITCSISAGWVVWSNLLASWEVPLYLQYGDGIPPYAYVALPKLNFRQRHDISVDLLVPFTSSNLLLGNFMTSLTLTTSSNKTLAHVRRPAIALPTASFFPLKPKRAHIKVPLLESFETGSSGLFARVEIGRQDHWKLLGAGQGRELSVISASLHGLAVPHGIRGLAVRFPLLAAITSAIIFLLILSLIIGLCLVPLLLRTTSQDTIEVKTETNGALSTSDSQPIRGRQSRPRRRSRSSRTASSERTSIPSEAPLTSVESTTKLRRRSSKPTAAVSISGIEI